MSVSVRKCQLLLVEYWQAMARFAWDEQEEANRLSLQLGSAPQSSAEPRRAPQSPAEPAELRRAPQRRSERWPASETS